MERLKVVEVARMVTEETLRLATDRLVEQFRPQRVILFGLCGHGHFDLSAYDAYLAGVLEDPEFSQADMDEALASLPQTPSIA